MTLTTEFTTIATVEGGEVLAKLYGYVVTARYPDSLTANQVKDLILDRTDIEIRDCIFETTIHPGEKNALFEYPDENRREEIQ